MPDETLALLVEHNADVVVRALRGPNASPLPALVAARTLAEVVEDVTRVLVGEARAAGHTWAEVGGLLRTTRQAAQQRFSANATDDTDVAPLATRAAGLVKQLRDGDWDAARADWDDTMREKLSAAELAEVWAQVRRSAGALCGIGRPSVVRKGPFRIADVPLAFEHGPMTARVTFDHAGAIAGLFILLPEAQ